MLQSRLPFPGKNRARLKPHSPCSALISAAIMASLTATPNFATTASSTTTALAVDSTPGSAVTSVVSGTAASSETLVSTAITAGASMSAPVSADNGIAASSTPLIYTLAGNGNWGESGDGGPASLASLNHPGSAVVDNIGNLYIADSANSVVRIVAAGSGIISIYAGTGTPGYSGDNGPATSAQLWNPLGLALDNAGNLYISDGSANVVRVVNANTGIITTYAGTATGGTPDDNQPATSASLSHPWGIAFDAANSLYIAETGANVVRMVASGTGTITTVAGVYGYGSFYRSGPATQVALDYPTGVAVDSLGNLYISDSYNNIIRQVTGGFMTTIAGSSVSALSPGGYSGDGRDATDAQLNLPEGLAVDSARNLYFADTRNNVIRKVTASGVITTEVGNSAPGLSASGDGGAATNATLDYPASVSVDGAGRLYIANTNASKIMQVAVFNPGPSTPTAAPVFSVPAGTYAGPQTVALSDVTPGAAIYITLDGTAPSPASLGYNGPIDVSGGLTIQAIAIAPGYLQSPSTSASYTITTPPTALINTLAGSGNYGFQGANGLASAAWLGIVDGVAVDGAANVYFSDPENSVVWKVASSTGIISVVAGNGTNGNSGDTGLATAAELGSPGGVAVDRAGNLYIADSEFNVVRIVALSTGIINTYAGGGHPAFTSSIGDGGPATGAILNYPTGLAVDSAGNLYISDSSNLCVRKVTASTSIITTYAGGGTVGRFASDIPATSLTMDSPSWLAVDGAGNLYIVDMNGSLIREVSVATGLVSTVAGNSGPGYSGDGALATSAEIYALGLAADPAGNLYLSNWPGAVREISTATGIITTIAGNGFCGYTGDGGSATIAEICWPNGIALDSAGNFYIADEGNYRIREVTYTVPTPAPVLSLAPGNYVGTQIVTISDSLPGAAIYYTLDGITPTADSNLYTAPVAITATETLQALATADGYAFSAVTSAAYSITPPSAHPITWPTPASIPYGVALSAAQLNATSSVDGIFTYTPDAGTVLNAGSTTLSVTFTPSDTAHYATATSTVTLVVNQAVLTVTADSRSRTYAAANPVLTSAIVGFVNGDTQIVVSGAPSLTTSATASSPVGAYPIVADQGTLSAANYSFAFINGTLNITQATPPITWSAPAAITYGTALSSTQLNATSSLPGTYVYTPAAGTVPAAGSYTLSVTLTPTDTIDYTTATASVTLQVNQAIPSITWVTPAAISYGTPLSATQLDATSAVPGAYAYTPAAGTVLSVGSNTLSVIFTPNDTADYTTATASVTLQVNQATPSIRWVTPAAISYGTPLSAAQLDATSAVPGAYAYTPAAGTVLSVGSYTLSVTFTPTDTTDYSTTTASVRLVVRQAVPSINWSTPDAIPFGTELSATQLDAASSVPGAFAYAPSGPQITPPDGNAQITLPTSVLNVPIGMAMDRAGNLFYADSNNNQVLELPAGGGAQTALPASGLNYPTGVAVDAAGDVFIADNRNNQVVELPWTGSAWGAQVNIPAGTRNAWGVAVDGTGNLYVADFGNSRVMVVPWTGTAWGTPTPLPATKLANPWDVAVDAAGDVFIADTGNNRVVEMPWTGTAWGSQITVGSGLYAPTSLAFDAQGDLFIAEPYYTMGTTLQSQVVELAWTRGVWSAPATLPATGLNTCSSVAVDGSGNVFILDTANSRVVELPTAGLVAGSQAAGAVLTAGPHTLWVTFTPADNIGYTIATASVTLVVTQATPSITWDTPAAIAYGTALSSTQLNATSTVQGTFAYTPPAGTLLNAGPRTLSVTFTPTDTTDYTTATASVTLQVNPATPSITWATPDAISYGTALSSAQLNATSAVPGTFAYTPPAGTLLTAGAQTLSATFTPSDTTNYTTVTATAGIGSLPALISSSGCDGSTPCKFYLPDGVYTSSGNITLPSNSVLV